jgi:hypothetical protein
MGPRIRAAENRSPDGIRRPYKRRSGVGVHRFVYDKYVPCSIPVNFSGAARGSLQRHDTRRQFGLSRVDAGVQGSQRATLQRVAAQSRHFKNIVKRRELCAWHGLGPVLHLQSFTNDR